MDQDPILGKWKQLGGRLRETWGRLTDDDLAHENGDRDHVIGKVQAHYGYSKERADQVVRDVEKTLQPINLEPVRHAAPRHTGFERSA